MNVRLMVLSGMVLLSGCLYHAREHTDQVVCNLAAVPYDLQPPSSGPSKADDIPKPAKPSDGTPKPVDNLPPTDLETSRLMEKRGSGDSKDEVRVVTLTQDQGPPKIVQDVLKNFQIPQSLPGADAPPIPKLAPEERARVLREIYKDLGALPEVPKPEPGPDGKPYTLADLQRIAATHSPTLRQAASDVEAARGAMIQAGAYPNPNGGFLFSPSSDATTPTFDGVFFDQTIKTAGKLRLAEAAALEDLKNAELALKRARSDLSTSVRNAYYALLVSEETVRVNETLARFTDKVYLLQINRTAEAGLGAPYEPAALRLQAYTVRLGLVQAIQNYYYNWKQLVTVIGEKQLPLCQVAGHVDSMIPYYEYDTVLSYALHRHTDVLTAYNGLDKARAQLKLQQVTPIPDVDINVGVQKEIALPGYPTSPTVTITMPIPIWDQNKGNILSAESALVRATEEPHRVELNLTNNLANAYNNYMNNLKALEMYRKYILPDLVRTYQGTYVNYNNMVPNGAVFNDVFTAQQALVSGITTYLTTLGQLWSSVVGVADFLQTDDLFQVGEPKQLPPLPDLEHFGSWPCCHDCPDGACACSPAVAPAMDVKKPAPTAAALKQPSWSWASLPVLAVPAAVPAPPIFGPPPAGLAPAGLPPTGLAPAGPPPASLAPAGPPPASLAPAGLPLAGTPEFGPPEVGPPQAGPPQVKPSQAGPSLFGSQP
jgi:outer membrane protein, heavy metal efflux system